MRDGAFVVVGWNLGKLDGDRLARARAALEAAIAGLEGEWVVASPGADAANDAVLGLVVVHAPADLDVEGEPPFDPADGVDAHQVTPAMLTAARAALREAEPQLSSVRQTCQDAGIRVFADASTWLVGVGAETIAKVRAGKKSVSNGPTSFGPADLKAFKGTLQLTAWTAPGD